MNFLLDVNISPVLGSLLKNNGHTFRFASTIENGTLTDRSILLIAKEAGEVIITHDLDFGELLAFDNNNKPSVILFRIHHINAALFYSLIQQNWNTIEEPLNNGALVVIEAHNIRIRKLPLATN